MNKHRLAVIGHPISHSASPRMQSAMIRSIGLPFTYESVDVSEQYLERFLSDMKLGSFKGINVTIPHKESVIPYLDSVDSLAKKIGAVNTIINRNGALHGYNTDGAGFLLSLEQESNYSVFEKHVVIIGAGGSAKSIAMSCASKSCASLTILNRTLKRAEGLKQTLDSSFDIPIYASNLEDVSFLANADVIINTTSVGMTPHEEESPLSDFSWCKSDQFVCDIIYNPEMTLFLKKATTYGCRVQNGSGMLAGQGALAFKLFTGYDADYRTMKDAI